MTVRDLRRSLPGLFRFDLSDDDPRLSRPITSPLVQKPGLVLTGLFEFLQSERIQILGRSELRYLEDLRGDSKAICERICSPATPCFVVTRGLTVPEALARSASALGIPVLQSEGVTAEVIEAIVQFLHVSLAPSRNVHGVMLDMFGTGVLLTGDSAVGKSECALELLSRGHRLVADDVVEVRAIERELVAEAPELTRNLLEIRGLGIINARDTFGIGAVRASKVVELVIDLVPLTSRERWDRLGGSDKSWECLGQSVSMLEIPVAPGRNLAVLVEMAVEQHLLRMAGSDARRDLQEAVARRIARQRDSEAK